MPLIYQAPCLGLIKTLIVFKHSHLHVKGFGARTLTQNITLNL